MEIEECYSLYSMRCKGIVVDLDYNFSNMGYLHIELESCAYVGSSLDLSLFDDTYWLFCLLLVVNSGEPMHLLTR